MHIRDIPYLPQYGIRGLLDLFGPEDARNCPTAVLIHGGALVEFSKERMAGVAEFLVSQGWAVANINYRLLLDASYPAALLDTLAAVDWVHEGTHPYLAQQDHARPLLLGASAGGFLALMAGFLLGKRRVLGVVSISGPALPGRYGVDVPQGEHDPRLFMAPTQLVNSDAPPTLLVHSRNDRLVNPREAITLAEAMADLYQFGYKKHPDRSAAQSKDVSCSQADTRTAMAHERSPAELYLFDGPGELHGIWREDRPSPQLAEHIEDRIAEFISHVP